MELAPALGWRTSVARRPATRAHRPSLGRGRRAVAIPRSKQSDEDRPHAPASLFNARKDPRRMMDDTTDEEANLPENPLNLDEDIVVPQRPGIDAIYEKLPGHPRPRRRRRDVAVSAAGQEGVQEASHGASGLPPPDPNDPLAPSVSTGDEELAEEVAGALRFEGAARGVREARQEAAGGGSGRSASGLPPPDPKASSVASLDSDDVEAAEELAAAFRFEGAGQAAREAREEHRRHEHRHGAHGTGNNEQRAFPENDLKEGEAPVPGSHEDPEVAPPGAGARERRMEQAERDATEMGGGGPSAAGAAPRPRHDLPGLVTEDTTLIQPGIDESGEPDAIEGAQSDPEERLQGLLEGIQKIQENEAGRQDPPHPDLRDALLGGGGGGGAVDASLAAMEGEEEINGLAPGGGPGPAGSDPHDWPESDPESLAAATLGDARTALPRVAFEFKTEKGDRPGAGPKYRSIRALAHGAQVLRGLAAKAAAAAAERGGDPLARLAAARDAAKAHHEDAAEALRRRPRVTAARVVEVAAGRSAAVGLAAAAATELLLRQSVMSQLLGRWEGPQLAEAAAPGARSAAAAVLAASLVAAAAEDLLAGAPPPAFPLAGMGVRAQLWAGRAAMLAFTALVLWEVAHSNRPALPTFFLW